MAAVWGLEVLAVAAVWGLELVSVAFLEHTGCLSMCNQHCTSLFRYPACTRHKLPPCGLRTILGQEMDHEAA